MKATISNLLKLRSTDKNSGFTLTELLVVVAILAIIVAITAPVVGSFRQNAGVVKCANSMRQVGTALLAYRADHNGWFPPGRPAFGNTDSSFNNHLIPNYLGELPFCPQFKLTDEGRKKYPDEKKALVNTGGCFAINAVLLQWKKEAMPWPGYYALTPYSDERMMFLMESAGGSSTWTLVPHLDNTLSGNGGFMTAGRNHGTKKNPAFNFMFLDGRIERVSRNDHRDIPENQKAWYYPANPTGPFDAWGQGGRIYSPRNIPDATMAELFPQYAK